MDYRSIRLGQIGNNAVIDFAVMELQRYLKLMDPTLIVDILLTKTMEPEFEGVIWVGMDVVLSRNIPNVADPDWDDAIVIAVTEGSGYITGSNPRSVLMGVYRFLRELGCRWVRPGKDGERIPNIEINRPSMSVYERPSYRYRCVVIEGANNYENIYETIDYLPKVGMNAYFVQFLKPLNFFERWYEHEGNSFLSQEQITKAQIMAMVEKAEAEIARRGLCYIKTGHGWTTEPFGLEATSWSTTRTYVVPKDLKERFAMVNGKRELWCNVPLDTNLCYSDPETRRIVVESACHYCQENRTINVLAFTLADGGNNHCECAACTVKDPSDWYVMMLNELDKKLTEVGLDNVKLAFAIYQNTMWIPKMETLHNKDRFVLTFAPITRVYGRCYDEFLTCDEPIEPYVHNRIQLSDSLAVNLKQLRTWQEVFDGDSYLFDYHLMWAHLNDLGGEACAKNLAADMKALRKIKLNGMVSCQVQRSFFPTALPFWMMASTLWDENCDEEQAAKDYYRATFGADCMLVRKYLQTISNLMLTYEGPWDGAPDKAKGPFCKDYVTLRKTVREFTPVIQRNLAKSNPCTPDWALLQLHQHYVGLVLDTLFALEQDDIEAADKAIEVLLDWMCVNELALQKVLDVFNTRRFWVKRLNLEAPGREWATPDI